MKGIRFLWVAGLLSIAVPARAQIVGDVNGDGLVDMADVAVVFNCLFQATPCPAAADLDHNGVVDVADLNALYAMLGRAVQVPAHSFGDVNGDGIVNMADVLVIADCLLQRIPCPAGADVNRNGVADMADLNLLVDAVLGRTVGPGGPPAIRSIDPGAVTAGGPGFTLTVNGSGFVFSGPQRAVVTWNGTPLPTTFAAANASSAQLTAAVPASLIASAGSANVVVSSQGTVSNSVTFTMGTLFCDLNGDGKVDRADVDLAADQKLQRISCTNADLDRNGACNDADVNRIVDVVLGRMGCLVGPAGPPAIQSVSPSTAMAGGPGFTLTVTGRGFVQGNPLGAVVYWSGQPLTTAVVNTPQSAAQLTAVVPASLLAWPGSANVVVSSQGTVSNSVIFMIGTPPPALASLSCAATSLAPRASSTCTVALVYPAPAGGTMIAISSNNASLAVPGFVAVPYGFTSTTFTVTAGATAFDQTATVTASLGGFTRTASLSLVVPVALSSLTCTPDILTSAASATCTLTLSRPAPTGGTVVALARDSTALAGPASVTVDAGRSTIAFSVTAGNIAAGQTATVTATLNGASKSAVVSLVAPLTITSGPPPGGTAGVPYSFVWSASGGRPPYNWSITGLPPGLAASGATIAGTPTTAGSFSITVQVTDSAALTSSKSLTLAIDPPALAITTVSPLPGGTVGVPYTPLTLAATGGAPPYTWSMQSLPPGLSASGATILGTPTAAGSFSFTVQVTDRATPPHQAVATLGLSISPGLTITTATVPGGTVGAAYSVALAALPGMPPYAWSIAAGALPGGLSLNPAAGTIGGTPTSAGPFTFTVKVTDSSTPPRTATRTYSGMISPYSGPPLGVTTTALPDGVVGMPYSAAVATEGGVAPHVCAIGAGSLPPGLTLDPIGRSLSGTPAGDGTFAFSLRVTDAASNTALQAFQVNVARVALTGLTPPQRPTTPVGVGVTLNSAISVPVAGRLVLSFKPNVPGVPEGYRDPALQFASGGTTLDFIVPPGATSATLRPNEAIQQGTVAGDITVSILPPLAPDRTVTVPRLPPVITPGTVQITNVTANGFRVEFTAYSTTREVASASFTFRAAAGTQIDGSATFAVDFRDVLAQWYAGSQGLDNGSAFHLQVPFTLDGDISAIEAVTVTLTNSAGISDPVTGGR